MPLQNLPPNEQGINGPSVSPVFCKITGLNPSDAHYLKNFHSKPWVPRELLGGEHAAAAVFKNPRLDCFLNNATQIDNLFFAAILESEVLGPGGFADPDVQVTYKPAPCTGRPPLTSILEVIYYPAFRFLYLWHSHKEHIKSARGQLFLYAVLMCVITRCEDRRYPMGRFAVILSNEVDYSAEGTDASMEPEGFIQVLQLKVQEFYGLLWSIAAASSEKEMLLPKCSENDTLVNEHFESFKKLVQECWYCYWLASGIFMARNSLGFEVRNVNIPSTMINQATYAFDRSPGQSCPYLEEAKNLATKQQSSFYPGDPDELSKKAGEIAFQLEHYGKADIFPCLTPERGYSKQMMGTIRSAYRDELVTTHEMPGQEFDPRVLVGKLLKEHWDAARDSGWECKPDLQIPDFDDYKRSLPVA
ncbi:hypothetical protein BJ508DRAFT_335640 [Ascobolus immersus RN42]|uniref:Uncharacterized protein n=1 Tax=Ascobolus immersus RN42 TaxID=1160509 RepID=A0A3N4HIP9_ASCIM|nr:hypothetical protein BJ508DRAFT_335640 [Ascobolus immersus RN42]